MTLWEAYSYAYWCTYARAAKRLWSLQCAVYVLTENWTAQPVLNSSVYYYYPQADEQRILFAEASGRKPIGGIAGLPGPSGPLGVNGSNWMSWYQGPAPRDVEASLSDWAWHDLRVIEEKLGSTLTAFEEVRRSLPIGRSLPDNRLILLTLSKGVHGPMGLPAPVSEKVRSAREEAIGNIADTSQRSSAKKNSDLLAELGKLAQALEMDASRAMTNMEGPYRFFPAGGAGAAFNIPTVWPELLGVLLDPLGPAGPAGIPGSVPDDEILELSHSAPYPLWSQEFADALASMQKRLEDAQRTISQTWTLPTVSGPR